MPEGPLSFQSLVWGDVQMRPTASRSNLQENVVYNRRIVLWMSRPVESQDRGEWPHAPGVACGGQPRSATLPWDRGSPIPGQLVRTQQVRIWRK